jgi:hypothetical protein
MVTIQRKPSPFDLHDERHNQLIAEVADPDAAVKLIQSALGRPDLSRIPSKTHA